MVTEYNFNYYEYKKRTKSSLGFSFTILLLTIILLTGLTVFIKPIKTSNYDFYFVKVNSFSTYTQANILSQEVKNSGGAGYVYLDKKYHVLVNFYQNEGDAESVAENLKTNYSNADVYKISAKKFKKLSNLSKNQNKSIENLSNFTISLISNLSQLSIQYDKNELNFNQISTKIKSYLNNFQDMYNEFLILFKTNSKYNLSREYACNIRTDLQTISNYNEEDFKKNFKYHNIDIILNYCSFLSSF